LVRIIFFEIDISLEKRFIKRLSHPEIKVVDAFFEMVDVVVGQIFLYCLEEFLIVCEQGSYSSVDAFSYFVFLFFYQCGYLFAEHFSKDIEDILIFDEDPHVFGIDILEYRRYEILIEKLEDADIGIDILYIAFVRQEESLLTCPHVL